MQLAEKQNSCVSCGQSLPKGSKLANCRVPKAEAESHGWSGDDAGDGAVVVQMCLQCQITRSKATPL